MTSPHNPHYLDEPTPVPEYQRAMDLCSWAWTIICNAGEGDWTRESADWQTAAAKFRDEYHAELDRAPRSKSTDNGTHQDMTNRARVETLLVDLAWLASAESDVMMQSRTLDHIGELRSDLYDWLDTLDSPSDR